MLRIIYDVISYYIFVIIYFFYYLLKGNSGDNENEEDVLKRGQESYYNKFNNIKKDYVSSEYYNNNKYFNSQTNHYNSLNNNFDYQQNKQQSSFYETICRSIKTLYSNIKYYLINIYHGSIYVLNCLWLLLSKPFIYLFGTIIYIIQVIFETLVYIIKSIWNYFFNNKNKINKGDKVGLRKKNDDIFEEVLNENILNNQLLDEKYLNRNDIKESECSSIANTQVDALKNSNENIYEEKNNDSLVNFKKYNENEILLTQKDNINFEINDEVNQIINNNTNNNFHNFIPPTPPPPLDDKVLETINRRNSPIKNMVHEKDILLPSSQINYQNMDKNDEYDDKNIGDWTVTRNVLVIDTNEDEKLNDNNYIFNNINSKYLPPPNPVKDDFFIGNSVFKPIPDMENYKEQFNCQKIDKFYENSLSPSSVPNITRNIREGTTFDINIHGDELKNKNYYITSPEERDTSTYNSNNTYSNYKNTYKSTDSPKNYHNTMSQVHYNIGDINNNPTLLSCKRTFERRIISRSYNHDSQGHIKKDWQVESYQAIRNEMPVSYNFYTRSAYK
ncbi:Hypothetical protein SRAE_X000254100 [Strongyloides ratti]|uniref:Uncharacterized protein n=1 Tax=Strongyloides ratti TaxID=34506 RepID=A0A090MRC9_STRRB|nr:Hypothetical protein SRAE_X000254100 [Strongyloides ratti]CEF60758.1 Hypothetical protein SRAE_X000254100 [Strongyloides ratti]